MEPFDYLAAEEALVARIRALLPDLAEVRGEASLAGMKESALRSPSALVVYAGDRLDDTSGSGRTSLISQTWLVVLAVKAPGDRSGSTARDRAGPLITQLLDAVQGWEPGERFTPFVRVNGPRPELLPGGTLFVPLAFETVLAL